MLLGLATLYWAAAVAAALVKICSSRVDKALRYGLRRLEEDAPAQRGSGLVEWVMRPNRMLPTRFCWPAFYATGVLVTACTYLALGSSTALNMFAVHVARRLLESISVQRFSDSALSPIHFAMGLSFYVMAAPTLGASHSSAGSLAMYAVFAFAQLVQAAAHRALATTPPLVGKYGIPQGPLFQVACPHYTAELLTFSILAMHARSFAANLLACFTFLNLVQSSLQTLEWYRRTFPGRQVPSYAILIPIF